MLKVSLLEILIRGIPEGFLVIFAAYTFSKTAINLKRYIMSGMILAIIGYGVRSLPIQYGVHTVIIVVALIIVMCWINKIEIIKSIRAGVTAYIVEFICEGINVVFIQFILKMDLNQALGDVMLKTLYGIPSLIIFGCIIAIIYIRFYKRKELKHISYGKVG